jgi:hypothetical protein
MGSHEKLSHTRSTKSKVRMSEKHTRFLGRHSAMQVGMRIDAARTSRFERLQS